MMIHRECLSQEHAELGDLATRLLRCLEQAAPDLEMVGRLRWCIARKLSAHLTKEDQMLYPRLRASANPHTAEMAERFICEMGSLSQVYRAYMTGWTADTIQERWPAFVADTRKMMEALVRRIQREENELYPLLAADAASRAATR